MIIPDQQQKHLFEIIFFEVEILAVQVFLLVFSYFFKQSLAF